MAHDVHHEHLIKEVEDLFKPLLSKSPQAIYIYLDDQHKICNNKFADMLGYESIKEWVDYEFPVEDLDQKDQEKGIKAYMNASRKLQAGSLDGTWVTKKGKKIKTNVILAPFTYKNEVFVLHFITLKK